MATGKSAWEVIANYEAHDIVLARYQAKHGWTPNAVHARELAAPFIQARHYYASAKGADRTVKPLLLYYGVVSLSRGLVLFLTRTLREASLAQSHGLSSRDWQSVLAAGKPDLGGLKIEVNGKGSFVELLRATGNRNLVRNGSSGVNQKFLVGPVATGTTLTFGELLASLPEVIDQLRYWRTPRCFHFSAQENDATKEFQITVPRWQGDHVDEHLVMAIIGAKHCKLVSVDQENIVVASTDEGLDGVIMADRINNNLVGIGDVFLAQRYASGAGLGKITQLFAISYILSMLVRYHPTSWMDLVHQRIGDAAMPTIFKAIDCIENLYPQIVVDFLEEK